MQEKDGEVKGMSDIDATGVPRAARASVETVLASVWDDETFTSNDVMPRVGLTRSTTIEAIDELIRYGVVEELPNARVGGDYRKGRPARRFAFRPDAASVVGVDAGRTHVIATVADLRGRPLTRVSRELTTDLDDPVRRQEVVAAVIDAALADAGIAREHVVAVCVGVPAPVDGAGRSPARHNDFWYRMNPDLADTAAPWAPLVRVENDASLAAVAESVHGAAIGCRNFVAILAGDRLGSGVVIDGHLLRGAHGGAGELIPFDHVTGVGSVDGIGVHVATWARQAAEQGRIGSRSRLAGLSPSELTAPAVFAAAREGDPDAVDIIVRSARVITRIASVFGGFFDPERIIFCGAVAESIESALVPARTMIQNEMHLPAPDLVASPLGADVVAAGAVAAATESARTHLLAFASAPLTAPSR